MTANTFETTVVRIQTLLDSCVAQGVPGVSATIRTTVGEEHCLRAGYSDLSNQTPLQDKTTFGIGSITKVFVAVVILQLVEEENLSLDDTVSSLLPSNPFLTNDPHASVARIRDFLNHHSGIASWEDDADWIPAGRGRDIQPGKTWRKDETLGYVKPSASAALTPGEFSYANSNYTLLGLIIERVTGRTSEGEIRQRILEHLGMRSTYIEGFETPQPDGQDPTPRRYHWNTPAFHETAGISPHFTSVPHRNDLVDVSASNLSVSWMAGGDLGVGGEFVDIRINTDKV